MKELTQEQKDKIKKLHRSAMKHSAFLGVKTALLLITANAVVIVADALYVHSQAFCFIGGFMNAIFIFRALNRETKKEHDRIKEEVKKILES